MTTYDQLIDPQVTGDILVNYKSRRKLRLLACALWRLRMSFECDLRGVVLDSCWRVIRQVEQFDGLCDIGSIGQKFVLGKRRIRH